MMIQCHCFPKRNLWLLITIMPCCYAIAIKSSIGISIYYSHLIIDIMRTEARNVEVNGIIEPEHPIL